MSTPRQQICVLETFQPDVAEYLRSVEAERDRLRAALVASDADMQTLREQHARACDERDELVASLPKCVAQDCNENRVGTHSDGYSAFCDDHAAGKKFLKEFPYAIVLRRLQP